MTTLEPEKKDILEKLNDIALEANWGTVDRVYTNEAPNGVPKTVAVIQEAVGEIKDLRKRIVFWRNDTKADEQVRKETAKEILQEWYNDVVKGLGEEGNYIIEIAQKYGVTLDEKNS